MRRRNPLLGMRIMICISLILSCSTSARDKSDKAATDYVVVGESQIALAKIPAGTFQMGTAQVLKVADDWDNDVEHPVHEVRITKAFWMGEFPVTQREWQGVMGNNPSYFPNAGSDAPVEQVSWNDAQAFITKVNAQQTRWIVRLPTEAEWEYASRAGTTGETYGPLDDIAWYKGNNSGSTHPVGQKAPNAFGLYDMLGNVWQWCQDWFAPYTSESLTDPQGAPTGEKRVMKGGCFYCAAIHCRAARRNRDPQDHLSRSIGFRIVAEARTGPSGQR